MKNVFLNNNNGTDDNFFNPNQFANTNSFIIEETQSNLSCSYDTSFSILHLNIRSSKRNCDMSVNFLATLGFTFKVACISET